MSQQICISVLQSSFMVNPSPRDRCLLIQILVPFLSLSFAIFSTSGRHAPCLCESTLVTHGEHNTTCSRNPVTLDGPHIHNNNSRPDIESWISPHFEGLYFTEIVLFTATGEAPFNKSTNYSIST